MDEKKPPAGLVRSSDLLGPLPPGAMFKSQKGLWYEADEVRAYAAKQVAAERERCIAAVEAVPTHRWVDGSDQWGRPCPAKIVATRTDYVAAIRGA